METANSRIYCFRADGRQGIKQSVRSGLPSKKSKPQEDIHPIDAICCKTCGNTITGRDQKIAVRGAHAHTFFNPAGIVFEIGCFSTAPGCRRVGEATSDFTWFAGYFWRFAICKKCQSHLGWQFEMGDNSFSGLILSNLKE
ncbi:MAG: cereblon family protein [Desulforhopalus sp.]